MAFPLVGSSVKMCPLKNTVLILTSAIGQKYSVFIMVLFVCCEDIKHLLRKLMIRLMDYHVDVNSSEEEEYSRTSPNRIRCSVASLADWYRNVTKVSLRIATLCTITVFQIFSSFQNSYASLPWLNGLIVCLAILIKLLAFRSIFQFWRHRHVLQKGLDPCKIGMLGTLNFIFISALIPRYWGEMDYSLYLYHFCVSETNKPD